jgi:hypothetical protein
MASGTILNLLAAPMRVRSHPFRLSREDIRVHALALTCVLVVLTLALTNPEVCHRIGVPYGSDFGQFYVLGELAEVRDGAGLYEPATLKRLLAGVKDPQYTYAFPPLYGPQVALIFMPFALLPYKGAAVLWGAISLVIYGYVVYAAWRGSPRLARDRNMVFLIALAFPPLWRQMLYLQSSVLLLPAFVLACAALRRNRPFWAGFALGFLALKPQHALVFGGIALAGGSLPLAAGAIVSLAAQFGAAAMWFGLGVLVRYVRALRLLPDADLLEPRVYDLHSWQGLFSALLSPAVSTAAWVLVAAVVIVLAVRIWRSQGPISARLALLIVATVLAGPHVVVYDTIILAPALVWLYDWALEHPTRRRLMHVTTYGLFSSLFIPFAKWIYVQPSVILLTVVFVAGLIWIRSDAPSGDGRTVELTLPRD